MDLGQKPGPVWDQSCQPLALSLQVTSSLDPDFLISKPGEETGDIQGTFLLRVF